MTAPSPSAVFPASIGRRVGAYAIDIAILWGVAMVLSGIFTAVLWGSLTTGDSTVVVVWAALGWLLVALGMLAAWLAYSAMQGGRGSIGQRALGLRLMDAESSAPIGFGRAVLRNLVFNLAGSIVVGYFTPLFDATPRRQGWHDMAARALVVDARGTDAAAALPALRPAAHPAYPGAAVPDARYAMAHGLQAPAYATQAPADSANAPAVPAAPAIYAPPVGYAAPTGFAPSPYTPRAAAVPPPPPGYTLVAPGPVAPAPAPVPASPAAPAAASPAPATPAEAPPVEPAAGLPSEVAPTVVIPVVPAAHTAPPAMPAPVSASSHANARANRPAGDVDDALDETHAAASLPSPSQSATALLALTWDDGTRMAAYGRTLYGRNPAPEAGAAVVAVRDETLSLSKTHFEVGADANGPWVRDRHSTNGTVLVRDGARYALVPGVPTTVRAGDRLEFGDRSAIAGAV